MMAEWIDVNERLPKNGECCFAHYVHSYCNDDYYNMQVVLFDGSVFRLGTAYKVTHWMPLPEPPKAGEDDAN